MDKIHEFKQEDFRVKIESMESYSCDVGMSGDENFTVNISAIDGKGKFIISLINE